MGKLNYATETRQDKETKAIKAISTWYASETYFINNGLQGMECNANASWTSTEKDGNRVLWVDLGNKKRFSVWLNPIRDEHGKIIDRDGVMVAIRFGKKLAYADAIYKAGCNVSKHCEESSFNNKNEYRLCVTVNQLSTMFNAISEAMHADEIDETIVVTTSESVTA